MSRRGDVDELCKAAVAWWHSRRPRGFTEEEHINSPTICVTIKSEKRLALEVAAFIKRRNDNAKVLLAKRLPPGYETARRHNRAMRDHGKALRGLITPAASTPGDDEA